MGWIVGLLGGGFEYSFLEPPTDFRGGFQNFGTPLPEGEPGAAADDPAVSEPRTGNRGVFRLLSEGYAMTARPC